MNLYHQIDVVDFSSKWTPLMRCCAMSGHVEVARELFFAGADVEKKDKDGKTALMVSLNRPESTFITSPPKKCNKQLSGIWL